MPSDQTLETQRLALRQFTREDFSVYARWMSDKQIMAYIGDGQIRSKEKAWNNFAWLLGHWQLRGYGLWAVELKESKELIGRIGLFNPAGWPGLEVGWLLDPAHWGHGYAEEGARASIAFAFNQLEEDSVISLIHPHNQRSIQLAQRLGMNEEKKILMSGNETLIFRLNRT
ncbi:MAG: GNAT family N-acetyltransferase [Gammaproteobacteria bacterium]|nr:GNAT family N-acetyltransferase [Gammaproteobacteria bacterium]